MPNVLTNIGKQIVTGRLLSVAPGAGTPGSAAPIHIGWGTGTVAAAAGDTALGTEETEARTAGTSSQVTTGGGTTNDTLQVTGTITALAAKNISEAGLFDTTKAQGGATPAGNLFIRGDFTAVPLETGDSIAFTFRWQIT